MVNGLIKYHKLGQAVILLSGHKEEFKMNKTEKVSMEKWNPLLLAIAYKKLDIVQYFLYDLQIALRHAGKRPGSEGGKSPEEMADQQVFSILIAIAN